MPQSDSEKKKDQLKEGECIKEGDLVYCREGGKVRVYPIDEVRGSLSETSVIASILGIFGVVLMPLPFIGISGALLAVMFGGVGLYQTRHGLRRGFLLALAGVFLGFFGIAGFILLMVRIFSLGAGAI